MVLERIFHDKDYWQEDAFNRIKSDLLSVKGNRFVQFNHTAATHLVCVYGKSQVGKTTLILNLIGLKDDDCKKNVAEVLRGGIALGNSSTSTAIIYSQSDSDDSYGVGIETLDGKKTANVEYCTSDKMPEMLASIRGKVESNEFSDNWILHIFIPKSYFTLSESESKISILDLPGVESRNIQEKAHVESLMTRYIPLSSVCIITCTANEIQYLEKNIELPNNIEWKSLPHKFYVLITRSYSVGNIKDYFKSPRNQRKTRFRDFLLNQYKEDLSPILGKDYKTKIFPLDMGASFERLCTEELQNKEDCDEVTETRDSILFSLRESILCSKGNNLISSIKELRVIVNEIENNKIRRFKENRKEKEEKLNRLGEKIERLKTNCNDYRSESQNIEDNIKTDKRLKEDLLNAVTSFADNLIIRVKKEVEEKSLFKDKNGIRYFYDKDRICMKVIQNHLMTHLDETVGSKVHSLNIDFYPLSIANCIYSKFVNDYESKLYPSSSSSFLKKLSELFGSSRKIDIQSAYGYIQQIKTIIQSEIQSSVINKCDDIISNKQEELNRCKYLLNKEEQNIKSKEKDIKRIIVEIDTNKKELTAVENQKMQDEQTLNGFLKHAEEAYKSQRSKIFEEINSNNTSPTDKFLYIVLLGIIDKEYSNITNTSNE